MKLPLDWKGRRDKKRIAEGRIGPNFAEKGRKERGGGRGDEDTAPARKGSLPPKK